MLHRLAPKGFRLPLLIGAIFALLAGAAVAMRGNAGQHRLGLFTSLPIVWNEAPDIAGMLKQQEAPHWARTALATYGTVQPLDTLGTLAGIDRLVMAQPRPLSPQENVALDNWVRAGGKLLLLADPALTEESGYALGDRRGPQSVVLLSPILRRWGLELEIDEMQPLGEVEREVMGAAVPVDLPGRFSIRDTRHCRSWSDGLAATCRVGKGRVLALADAAVLDRVDPEGKRSRAFANLLDAAFVGR